MAERTPAQQIAWLQEQLEAARKSHSEAYEKHRAQVALLRTDLDRALDRASAEAARANLAEERIGRLRDRLDHAEDAGARRLASEWDLERKRRARA